MGADVSTSHRISQVICYRDTKETESEDKEGEKRRENVLTRQKKIEEASTREKDEKNFLIIMK